VSAALLSIRVKKSFLAIFLLGAITNLAGTQKFPHQIPSSEPEKYIVAKSKEERDPLFQAVIDMLRHDTENWHSVEDDDGNIFAHSLEHYPSGIKVDASSVYRMDIWIPEVGDFHLQDDEAGREVKDLVCLIRRLKALEIIKDYEDCTRPQ
jgi:hypothetical protein